MKRHLDTWLWKVAALTLHLATACHEEQALPGDCTRHGQCDDDVFCNGEERCEQGTCVRGAKVDCDDGIACTHDVCDESLWACRHDPPDEDDDGHGDLACVDARGRSLGDDCDDQDPRRHPGAEEVCDLDHVDEDCDPSTVGGRDEDGDGALSSACCNVTETLSQCGADCDDDDRDVNPRAPELCDERDNDCDHQVDEDVRIALYEDRDGDGFGAGEPVASSCVALEGFATRGGDCDDERGDVRPNAFDACEVEAIDQDCNGVPNDPAGGCGCTPGATQACPFPGRCAEGVLTCVGEVWAQACSITPIEEDCNAVDDDCDGSIDEGVSVLCYPDADGDGFAPAGAEGTRTCPEVARADNGGCPVGETPRPPTGADIDCAPGDASIGPTARETCDGIDEDCDGSIDEGLPTLTRYIDGDGDGHAGTAVLRCATDPRSTATAEDCMDDNPLVHPMQRGVFTRPACGTGRVACEDAGQWRCRTPEQACSGSLPAARWDYDCDGEGQGPMLVVGECRLGVCGEGCGDSGFKDEGRTPDCGESWSYQTCRCLGAQGGGCDASLDARVYPCR